MLVSKLLTAVGPAGSFWMPPQVSTVAGDVDALFGFILWLSVFFFCLIVGLMVFFLLRYRVRAGRPGPEPSPSHNMALEITWTAIPIAIVLVIFVLGFKGYMNMATPPANAYEVRVVAQKWNWSFTYPNGYVDENLHVPVNRPVRLIMSSEDVIHSVFVPAFRIKRDVVPGRYATAWFEATQPGEYDLFCAEYCGTSHSDMLATVVVHPAGEFEGWLERASDFLATMSPVDAGRKLYQARGCAQCHSVDGTGKVGPTFKDLFGESQRLTSGASVAVDENYLRESILAPQDKIVAGYDPVMPTYQGRLKDAEVDAIITYIKSLSVHGGIEQSGPTEAEDEAGAEAEDDAAAPGGAAAPAQPESPGGAAAPAQEE